MGSGTASVEGVVVNYKKRRALDHVSLDFAPGIHAILGPNGAGKSTLLYVLATVKQPDEGACFHGGTRIADDRSRRAARANFGYLPQSLAYPGRFTVREYLRYVAWLRMVPRGGTRSAVDSALERVGLQDRADDQLRTLSGGMMRRAGIAQAIINDPAILLLDEPTVGLDPEQRSYFRRLIEDVAAGRTVILATHLTEEVAALCDRVAILASGRVRFEGSIEELCGTSRDKVTAGLVERGYIAKIAS
jgi:ABC-2 type transport system ATP-binding protein